MKPIQPRILLLLCSLFCASLLKAQNNPVFPGWYADPEGSILAGKYWVFPTFSAPYNKQVFMDAFSSPDLVNWTKHPHIIDTSSIKWAKRAMWAPSIIEKKGKYYFFFGANDIHYGRIARCPRD